MASKLKVDVTNDEAHGAPLVTPTSRRAKTTHDVFASPAPPPRKHVPKTPAPLLSYKTDLKLHPTNMIAESETKSRIDDDLILYESFVEQANPDAKDEF